MAPTPVPTLTLNDGVTIPQLGLGVWQVDPAICARVVEDALAIGYRSIDTAEGYRNEEGVGEALRRSGLSRNDVFITSKLRNGAHRRDDALRAFDDTMAKLGVEVLDLFLIHWPLPSYDLYVEAWQVLVELKAAGRIRSIGTSNFNPDHLERIIAETGVVPSVNQIELHPRFQQRDKRDIHQRLGIAIESWSPLGSGRMLDDAVVGEIARAKGRTVAQVILRWHLEQGLIVIPKSIHKERMEENFALFDFSLTPEEMARIDALDLGAKGRNGNDPAVAAHLF